MSFEHGNAARKQEYPSAEEVDRGWDEIDTPPTLEKGPEPISEKRPRKPEIIDSTTWMQVEDADLAPDVSDEPTPPSESEVTEESGVHRRPARPRGAAVAPPVPNPTPRAPIAPPETMKRPHVTTKRMPKVAPLSPEAEPANDNNDDRVLETDSSLEFNSDVPDINARFEKESLADSEDDLGLFPAGLQMRIADAVKADPDVLLWHERLSQLDKTDLANNERQIDLNNKIRKVELLAQRRIANEEIDKAEERIERAEKQEDVLREQIEAKKRLIEKEKKAIQNAKENPRREEQLKEVSRIKNRIDDTYEMHNRKVAERLKELSLSEHQEKMQRMPEEERIRLVQSLEKERALLLEKSQMYKDSKFNRPASEQNLAGKRQKEFERMITHDTEVEIPMHEQNIALFEKELVDLQAELHRQELIQKHGIKLIKTAEEIIKDMDVSIEFYKKIPLKVEEDKTVPSSPESVELIPEETVDITDVDVDIPVEEVSQELILDLRDLLGEMPEGKRFDAKRNLLRNKIRKAELLLEEKDLLKQAKQVKEEATELQEEITDLEADFQGLKEAAEEASHQRALFVKKIDQKREARERLYEDLKKDPDRAEELTTKIKALDKEIVDDEILAEKKEEEVTKMEGEAGEVSDRRDAVVVRHKIALDKWIAITGLAAELAVKLEPLSRVTLEKPEQEKTRAQQAKELAAASGRMAGKSAKKLGWAGIWAGVGVYGLVKGVAGAGKKVWDTFNGFEQRMERDGFFGALKWFFVEDGAKKKEE